MGQLIDLKLTKAELKEEGREMSVGPSGKPDPYPWGTSISLTERELGKLGLRFDQLEVGAEIHMAAVATVTSLNQNSSEEEGERQRVGLQLRMIQIVKVESAAEEKGEKETPKAEAKETPKLLEA